MHLTMQSQTWRIGILHTLAAAWTCTSKQKHVFGRQLPWGLEKLRFMDRIPYLLASLDKGSDIAQRALDQFAEAPEKEHHRVSLRFLGAHSMLREHVCAVASGGPLSEDLLEEVLCLQ